MSVFIYGPPQSTYVRTVCMVCIEKRIRYELKDVEFGSQDHMSLHPFARIPILRHRDFILCESSAITRYLDQVFEGPKLVPAQPRQCGVMNQWISTVNDYYYDVMIRQLVLPRLGILPLEEENIAELKPRLEHQFAVADRALAKTAFIASDHLTLADLFLTPIIAQVMKTPEGGRTLPEHQNLVRWLSEMMERDSFNGSDILRKPAAAKAEP